MSSEVTSIRLTSRDTMVIDHYIKDGTFNSKSDFIRYAVRKTINEMVLRDIREKIGLDNELKNISPEKLEKEVKDIRKKLWEEYSETAS